MRNSANAEYVIKRNGKAGGKTACPACVYSMEVMTYF